MATEREREAQYSSVTTPGHPLHQRTNAAETQLPQPPASTSVYVGQIGCAGAKSTAGRWQWISDSPQIAINLSPAERSSQRSSQSGVGSPDTISRKQNGWEGGREGGVSFICVVGQNLVPYSEGVCLGERASQCLSACWWSGPWQWSMLVNVEGSTTGKHVSAQCVGLGNW